MNARRKRFAQEYAKTGNGAQAAVSAGFSKKAAKVTASRLLTDANVRAEIARLSAKVEDASICSIAERKQILSEIARGRLQDFCTSGADGFVPNVGLENLNSRALKSVTTKVICGGKDTDQAYVTKLELRDPAQAIEILNKMDGVYAQDLEEGEFRCRVVFEKAKR
jgi:phage terminase small subunit